MAKTSRTSRKSSKKNDDAKSRRRTPPSPQDVVATIKGTQLYKVLRREGIAKKKAGRIVRAATAPVRVAVDAVEALPSSDVTSTTPTPLADLPPTLVPEPVPAAAANDAGSSADRSPSRRSGTTTRKRATRSAAARTARSTSAPTTGRTGRSTARSGDSTTKADLMKRAREAGIAGRSGMSKAQLESALEAAPRRG